GPTDATAGLGLISGTGTLAGGAMLNAGSIVAPGGSGAVGTLTATDGLTLKGAYQVDVLSPASKDLLDVHGNLILGGTNILTLSGPNTFSGGVTIEQGTVQTDEIGNIGQASPIGSGAGLTLGSDSEPGRIEYTGSADITTNRNFIVKPGGAILDFGGF